MTSITTIAELQLAINALVPLMLEKGLVRPEAKAHVEANTDGGILLSWRWREQSVLEPWDEKNYKSLWIFARAQRPDGLEPWAGALRDARMELEALPGKPEREREEFLKLLAAATEYGRSVGIEEEFVNPLAILAKKLSENALTHRPEGGGVSDAPSDVIRLHVSDKARAGLVARVRPMDDEIPF